MLAGGPAGPHLEGKGTHGSQAVLAYHTREPLLAWAHAPARSGLACGRPCRLHPSARGCTFRGGHLAALAPPSEAGVPQALCVGSGHPPPPFVLALGSCASSLDVPCVRSTCCVSLPPAPARATDEDAGSREEALSCGLARPSSPGLVTTCLPPWWSAPHLPQGPWPRALLPPGPSPLVPELQLCSVSFSGAAQDSWASKGTQGGASTAPPRALGPGSAHHCTCHRDRTSRGLWAGRGGAWAQALGGLRAGGSSPWSALLGPPPRRSPATGSALCPAVPGRGRLLPPPSRCLPWACAERGVGGAFCWAEPPRPARREAQAPRSPAFGGRHVNRVTSMSLAARRVTAARAVSGTRKCW